MVDFLRGDELTGAASTTAANPKQQLAVKTGDEALDKEINDIIAKKGKNAAIQYLIDMKNKLQSAQASAAQGEVRTASNGQEYRLDFGKRGDRIWVNVKTGYEATAAIDRELESASQKQGTK